MKQYLGDWTKPEEVIQVKPEMTTCELCGEPMRADDCMPYSSERCPQYDCHEACYEKTRMEYHDV